MGVAQSSSGGQGVATRGPEPPLETTAPAMQGPESSELETSSSQEESSSEEESEKGKVAAPIPDGAGNVIVTKKQFPRPAIGQALKR